MNKSKYREKNLKRKKNIFALDTGNIFKLSFVYLNRFLLFFEIIFIES